MATIHVAFDARSGRILSVHHGAMDAKEVSGVAQYHMQYHGRHDAKVSDERVAVITVPSDAVEQGKRYKVDVKRKALVATGSKDGVGFGFGVTGRSS